MVVIGRMSVVGHGGVKIAWSQEAYTASGRPQLS